MAKDYYKTLGLNKNASADEIRQAFREMAQKHHPDKGGDAEKFKSINEAYQVLSNPEKRHQYDQYGQTFEQAQAQGAAPGFEGFGDFSSWAQGMGGQDLGDILGQMFGGQSPFGGGGHRRPRARRGENLEVSVTLDLKDLVRETPKTITLERLTECHECKGKGVATGSKIIKCTACHGRGSVMRQQRTMLGTFQSVVTCDVCQGEGEKPEKVCKTCRGDGRERNRKELEVKIPAGVEDGMALRLSGQGNVGERGTTAGDCYVHIRVRPDPRFRRDGADLTSGLTVALTTAVLGGDVKVATIDGEGTLTIPAGTRDGTKLRLKGKGLGRFNASSHGDHYVVVHVTIPEKLNRDQRKQFEQLRDSGL